MENKLLSTIAICAFGLSGHLSAQKGFNLQGSFQLSQTAITGGIKAYEPLIFAENESYVSLNSSFNIGFETGIAFGYNFNDNLGIGIGINYARQNQFYQPYFGTETGYVDNEFVRNQYETTRSLSMDYLRNSLVFKFTTNPEKVVSFNAYLGPYFGVLLSYYDYQTYSQNIRYEFGYWVNVNGSATIYNNTIIYKGSYQSSFGSDSYDERGTVVTWPYNRFDFGLTTSVGISINVSPLISIPVMFNNQIGFLNLKNMSGRYRDSYGTYSYWEGDPNRNITSRNLVNGISTGIRFNF